MNYGEVLACWYLRLNGFIPMRDFVLHRGPDRKRASDIDLLAIRLPHAHELVGGQRCALDGWFEEMAGIVLEGSKIAVMAEAKTGLSHGNLRKVESAFSRNRLRDAVDRLGAFRITDRELKLLYESKSCVCRDWTFLKLAFVDGEATPTRCHALLLSRADEFIRERLSRYQQKFADRLLFQDPLIGYLAWHSHLSGHL